MKKTSLYRHFDADGRLLYIGISKSAIERLSGHKLLSHWYWEIARIDVETHNSRALAAYAEAVAIRDEGPLYNLAKPIPTLPRTEEEIAEERMPPFVPEGGPWLPFEGNGARVIAYTLARDKYEASDKVGAIASSFTAVSGIVFSDIGEPGGGRVAVLKAAQHCGTLIATDRPSAFDGADELFAERQVLLRAGDDIAPVLAEVEREAKAKRQADWRGRQPKTKRKPQSLKLE